MRFDVKERMLQVLDRRPEGKLMPLLEKHGVGAAAYYGKACRRIYEAFRDYPRTREGGFIHVRNGLRGQMWVDGVFMGQVFYCRYGRMFREPACFDAG